MGTLLVEQGVGDAGVAREQFAVPCTLRLMSLFDATAVTPPLLCSRCNERVVATSLFCPVCGQSMTRPLPVDVVPEAEESAPEPDISAETPSTDPLQRATGWLRRSLSLGRKPDEQGEAQPEVTTDVDQPTEAMSLFDIEEAERSAEAPARKATSPVRFLLKFESGLTFTVGETPGIIGVKPLPEEPEEGRQRLFLEDDTDTVAPEHLEFGVKRGVFWVKDLKTVAGTVVEEPGSPALQCIPYDVYPLVRGSKVVMGNIAFTLQ